jgi:hypothetical protein
MGGFGRKTAQKARKKLAPLPKAGRTTTIDPNSNGREFRIGGKRRLGYGFTLTGRPA